MMIDQTTAEMPMWLRQIADEMDAGAASPPCSEAEIIRDAAIAIERLHEIKILDNDQYDISDKLTDLQNERDWALADVERLRVAAVKAVVPLELIRTGGWQHNFSPDVVLAIDEGIAAVRAIVNTDWRSIQTAPRDGTRIILLIPYDRSEFSEEECTDLGQWDIEANCFRFNGDDGPQDIQPTHWKPFSN